MANSRKDILLGLLRSGGQLTLGQQIRLCLSMSYPAILAQLSSVMMQYIDTAMVGHLGPAAGASIGLVSTCLWLFGGFGMAATTGFSVQVAHCVGANDFEGARSVVCFSSSVSGSVRSRMMSSTELSAILRNSSTSLTSNHFSQGTTYCRKGTP